jgi:hypothetical protein
MLSAIDGVSSGGENTMTSILKKLARPRKGVARRAYEKLETRILVAQGRKVVRAKAAKVGKVTRKAVKTALITGGIAAAGVVVRAIRKQRPED